MDRFQLVSGYEPRGDQGRAIEDLISGVEAGERHQVLLGVTGSGKTFTIANVVERLQRPTLVIAHNKTLAAQLYGEFKELFPHNAVEFFVSYYDYYQPEAYLPNSDTFIEKDAMINDDIDRLRHSATRAVLERKDTLVVASVSCIYGIGSPEDYLQMHLVIETGQDTGREELLRQLVRMQYRRSEGQLLRGGFRTRGDVVEIYPPFSLDKCLRVEFFGDEVDRITEFDPLTGTRIGSFERVALFPTSHWVTPKDRIASATGPIEREMWNRKAHFLKEGREVEAQRIEQRTLFDMEMLKEFGYCHGIENYSRYLSGRKPGDAPYTLMDYFPDDFLVVIDESHATIPQLGGMYAGDRARKGTLIEFGFRLPSALDNRPLSFDEFAARAGQAIYVSATPGPYELEMTGGTVVEQINRPTGLLDPEMEIRPVRGQVDDLLAEIRERRLKGERVLITTLTKKMAEDLATYYTDLGVRARYLHSDVKTLERVEIIRDLRRGLFDVLIGVNLLREGLDLPEVSLVAIFDADKEGFLRSERSLIQTAGRAARNSNGLVILYADAITGSMRRTLDETDRRRAIQHEFNELHGIVPTSVTSQIKDITGSIYESTPPPRAALSVREEAAPFNAGNAGPADDRALSESLASLEEEMRGAASKLEFERAAALRDRIKAIKERMLFGQLDTV